MIGKFPRDFTPDLHRLKYWPAIKNGLWRAPYLVELTHAENFRLVQETIQGRGLRILDVGCGTGFMSLELSRLGHEVLGIDSNEEIIRIAKRTMETDPYKKKRGGLRYQVSDFVESADLPEGFDLVLFSRVLHDMPHPEKVISKARNLLKKDGELICIEYAYDRLDRRAAIWLYQVRKTLQILGLESSSRLPDDPKSGVDHIMNENFSRRKEHINRFEEMRDPLTKLFHEETMTWHPYLFWDIIGDMKVPDRDKEKQLAALLRRTEAFLIETAEIQPVMFRFLGRKEAPGNVRIGTE